MNLRSIIRDMVPKSGRIAFRKVFREKAKRQCRAEIKQLGEQVKIIVGTGYTHYDGWVSTDIHQLNILKEADWRYLLKGKKVANILSEHVWEHINLEDAKVANKLCYKFLAKGGKIRIAVPDGFFPDPAYIDFVKPGGNGPGCDDHKLLYNYKILEKELADAGFQVKLLEYWDEQGHFHFNNWSPEEGGMICRSSRFDPSNATGTLKYTSLIVDAIKP